MKDKKMNIGVLGANGFIGSWIYSKLTTVPKYRTWPYSRINNGLESFIKNSNVIIHAVGVNRGSHEDMIETNINFTLKVAELCKKYNKKLIYIGTRYNKKDSYAFSKKIAENILESYIDNFGCNFYIVRLPKVIGRGCKPYYNSFLTTILYEYAHKNQDKLKINDLNELVHFITIENVLTTVCWLIENDDGYSRMFNCPGSCAITFKNLLDILEQKNTEINEVSKYFLDLMEYYKSYDVEKQAKARGP
jgi:UDP-2-acetamido-2,6-beta-L-arabino-hexul-4-ose reductase